MNELKRTVPVYLGEAGTPNRPRIGWAKVDPVTGIADVQLDEAPPWFRNDLLNTSIGLDDVSVFVVGEVDEKK